MSEATVMLCSMGVEEALDPIRIIHTGVKPKYEGPQIFVDSQAALDEQKMIDDEAEELSNCMQTCVLRSATTGDPTFCAIDGSGEGYSGPGIYFEHMWLINDRSFIKQHTMINLKNQRVTAFAITLESPADPRMLVPLISGALLVGVNVRSVAADSAYDTKANWLFMDEKGIAFCPNLKENFKSTWEMKRREALRSFDERFGKELAHRMTGYNDRWLVEAFFSIFKKLYGDRLRNRSFPKMVQTMEYRYTLYDIHRDFMIKARQEATI